VAKNDLQGTLDLLVLKTLSQMVRCMGMDRVHVQDVSDDLLKVEEDRCIRRCIGWSRTVDRFGVGLTGPIARPSSTS